MAHLACTELTLFRPASGRPGPGRKGPLTSDGTTTLALLLGVDAATAERIGDRVDLVVPLFVASALAAARTIAVRAGRISLAGHEAQGGHTIARHVAQTEEQLRARLAAQTRIPAASSFETLIAGRESRICRASCQPDGYRPIGQEQLHRTASDAFDWISFGPNRSWCHPRHGQLAPMSKVRIVLQKKAIAGKLYYILTAFPIP